MKPRNPSEADGGVDGRPCVLSAGLVCLLVALCLGVGCGDRPKQETLYEMACRTARESADFPAGAVIAPLDATEFFVCKNAARVDLETQVRQTSGRIEKRVFTVWFRNMAHSWEVDRASAGPVLAPAAQEEPAPTEVAPESG